MIYQSRPWQMDAWQSEVDWIVLAGGYEAKSRMEVWRMGVD